MKPDERLNEIKAKIADHSDHEMCDGIHELFEDELPWLIERVERLTCHLEKVCAPESDGFGDVISDEFMAPEILEARKFLKGETGAENESPG